MSRFRLRNLLIALIFLSSVSGFSATNGKISPDLAAQTSNGNFPVIIQYKTAPSSLETGLLGLLGGVVTLVLSSINAIVATVPLRQLSSLAADPNVTYISLDRAVTARNAGDITAAEYTAEPINAPVVWAKGYQGTNIGVAVIDSGITPVPDLASNSLSLPLGQPVLAQLLASVNESAPWSAGRIVYSQNFVKGQSDALDHFGHGTHVAGLIAGNGNQSSGSHYFRTFIGTAPNANLINLRVLDQNGAGTDSSVIAAIDRAIALKNVFNIRVINLSLGRPIYESYTLDPLCQE